jgi:hypothetical protein
MNSYSFVYHGRFFISSLIMKGEGGGGEQGGEMAQIMYAHVNK